MFMRPVLTSRKELGRTPGGMELPRRRQAAPVSVVWLSDGIVVLDTRGQPFPHRF